MDWEIISYIMASKYRKSILQLFSEFSSIYPTMIKKKTKLRIEHISKILKEFMEKKIIVCLTPNAKKGKMFEITPLGKEIIAYIKSLNDYNQ